MHGRVLRKKSVVGPIANWYSTSSGAILIVRALCLGRRRQGLTYTCWRTIGNGLRKSSPPRATGRGSGPRGSRFDRGQFDSELAERVMHIIQELKSTSDPSVRLTKYGILRRAACLKSFQFFTELPKTQSVLNEHVETMAEYRVRKISWAIAQMARKGQAITGESLRRMAALSTTLLNEYKPLILQTAQQLKADVSPNSFFTRLTERQSRQFDACAPTNRDFAQADDGQKLTVDKIHHSEAAHDIVSE